MSSIRRPRPWLFPGPILACLPLSAWLPFARGCWSSCASVRSRYLSPCVGCRTKLLRYRRSRIHQAFGLEIAPQRLGDPGRQCLHIEPDLLRSDASGNHGDDRGMGEGKAQRGFRELYLVTLAHGLDAPHALKHVLRRLAVIVSGVGLGSDRQNAGVVRAAEHNADAALLAERKKTVEGLLLEQRVASRKQENVEIAASRQYLGHFPLVDAGAEDFDDLLVPQLDQRLVAGLHQRLDMGIACFDRAMSEDVDVMHEEYLDRVDPQALEREFERAHDSVVSVIKDLAARRRVEELADAQPLFRRCDLQQASDLGRDDILAPGLAAQEMIEPRL